MSYPYPCPWPALAACSSSRLAPISPASCSHTCTTEEDAQGEAHPAAAQVHLHHVHSMHMQWGNGGGRGPHSPT